MQARLRWQALSLAVLLAMESRARGGEGVDWLARAKSEIPTAWSTLERDLCQLDGRYTLTVTKMPVKAGPVISRTWTVDFAVNGALGNAKSTRTSPSGDGWQRTFAVNPDYQFEVERKKSATRFSLSTYDKHKQVVAGLLPTIDSFWDADKDLRYLLAGENLNGTTLSSIAQGVSGAIRAAGPMSADGHLRLLIDCRMKDSRGESRDYPGVVVVLPGFYWSIATYDQDSPYGSTHTSVEYQPDNRKFPFPRHMVLEYLDSRKQVTQRSVADFEAPKPTASNPSDFVLAAYELNEPGRVSGRSRLLLANVIGLLLMGVAFAVLSRWKGRSKA